MAFTKSPMISTYSTERVQLTREINSRAGGLITKDEDFLNVIIEPEKNKSAQDKRFFIMKRAGTRVQFASVGTSKIRGMHYWAAFNKLLYVVGTTLYIYNFDSGITTTLVLFTSTTGDVGFTEFLYQNGDIVIILTDGTKLYTVDNSNVYTLVTSANLPTPHYPQPIYLDGYLFLAKANSADVYNSVLNDPISWTAGDYITAEMEPDKVVRICKINNYLAVFGTDSIEYFWDAANTSGSPLQRNDTPIKLNKYIGAFSQYGNSIYFIGKSTSGQPDVFMLEDFKIKNIGSPSISRYLNTAHTDSTAWVGSIIGIQGHTFYTINLQTDYTYVFDIENTLWSRWAYGTSNKFNIQTSCSIMQPGQYYSLFSFPDDSYIYTFDETLYQDNGVNFTSQIVTEASDFGTMNRKTMKRLSIIGDRPASSGVVNLYWSDDDYKSWQGPVDVEMDQDLPSAYQLGSFRQRIFKLAFTSNNLWRVQELEVDINKGAS